MLNFGMTPLMPCCIEVPNVSFTCMNTTDFGATPVLSNSSFWLVKASLRIIGADQELRAVADQLLGPRPRHLDVGLGVGVHDRQLRQPQFLEDRRRQFDTALAILPDAGLG